RTCSRFPYTTLFRSEVAAGVGIARRGTEAGTGQAEPERTHRIGDAVADVPEQAAIELLQAGLGVRILRRLHFPHHPRMAQDRALDRKSTRPNSSHVK